VPPAGRVYLIGAGPGDPGLISARGIRLLAESDVIVYDKAVEPVLRWAPASAERIAAGAPAERETPQDAISMLLAEKARDGHVVARLKWGDPFVFDSGAKEALFLHEQGIAFEVVPGIPAAIGATAYAGIPVTYPGSGDAVVLLRGYEGESDVIPEVDWDALARIDGTLVCYAGGRLVPVVLTALLEHGVEPERPAALICGGTYPGQQTTTGTVRELLDAVTADGHRAPALLVVGEVASFREHLRWFDERPLFGRRVVVTRSPEQAGALVDALENLGAQAIEAPTFRLAPPEDPEALDRAAASVDGYDWVVFESATAVTRFLSTLTQGPRDVRALGGVRLCAIGPSTADRLAASGLKADVIVPEVRVDSIGDALAAQGSIDGQRLLIVRPDHLRDTLAQELISRGASVTDLVAYRTEAASADSVAAQRLYRMLLDGQVDAVTFTSPTAIRRFAALIGDEQAADLLNTTVVATIGPVTAAAARELGVTAPLVPDSYTVDGLMRVLVEHFARDREAPVR
jgi:uroporphyrinogen III methyltransferase/synthase